MQRRRNETPLSERVREAAAAALNSAGKVSAFDVLMRMNWLHESHVKQWLRRHECYEFIEMEMQSTAEKRLKTLRCFEQWGTARKLETTAVAFYPRVRDEQAELQVTVCGHPELERLYRLCFIKPGSTTGPPSNHSSMSFQSASLA